MQKLDAALKQFVEQQDLYNEAYGLFRQHDLRPREQPYQPQVDKRIPISPELMYTGMSHMWSLPPGKQITLSLPISMMIH